MTQKEMFEKSFERPTNFFLLSAKEQWEIDKLLGILDWDPDILTPTEKERYNGHYRKKYGYRRARKVNSIPGLNTSEKDKRFIFDLKVVGNEKLYSENDVIELLNKMGKDVAKLMDEGNYPALFKFNGEKWYKENTK